MSNSSRTVSKPLKFCFLQRKADLEFLGPDGEYESDGGLDHPHRGPPKELTIETFVVEMKYIQRVFRQEFWDTFSIAVSKDAAASQLLMIPKTVGLRAREISNGANP